jgi:hypothetical protein
VEAKCSSETSAGFQSTAQRYIAEDFGDINCCCPGYIDCTSVQLPSVTVELLLNFKFVKPEAHLNIVFKNLAPPLYITKMGLINAEIISAYCQNHKQHGALPSHRCALKD